MSSTGLIFKEVKDRDISPNAWTVTYLSYSTIFHASTFFYTKTLFVNGELCTSRQSPRHTRVVETFVAALTCLHKSKLSATDIQVTHRNVNAQKCFVFQLDGKIYLVVAGYPVESSVSSIGSQSVIGKIKNEIKSGNPVTWSWRGGGAFKKFSPKKQAEVDKAQGNLSADS
jgi:hypothetical protein